MNRSTTMGKKVCALFVTAVMALTMCAAVPAMAFASTPSDTVASPRSTGWGDETRWPAQTMTVGSQLNITNAFNEPYSGTHIDFKVTEGTGVVQVNKHSGLVTANAVGTAVVTAYLVQGDQPTQNPNNPDGTVLDSASLQITVVAASSYGFQGSPLSVKLTNHTVKMFDGSQESGYVNQLGAIQPDANGNYLFTIQMSHGFKDYATPLAYAQYNKDNIVLMNAEGTQTIASLNASNRGAITIDSVDNANRTITVKVNGAQMGGNSARVVLQSALKANKVEITLGTTVGFVFTK